MKLGIMFSHPEHGEYYLDQINFESKRPYVLRKVGAESKPAYFCLNAEDFNKEWIMKNGSLITCKFSEGDKVFNVRFGWGKVVVVDWSNSGSEVFAGNFEASNEEEEWDGHFTVDGKIDANDKFPSLLTKEEAVAKGYPPPPKNKTKIELDVWTNLYVAQRDNKTTFSSGIYFSEHQAKMNEQRGCVAQVNLKGQAEVDLDD
jgi:hypothetical protein